MFRLSSALVLSLLLYPDLMVNCERKETNNRDSLSTISTCNTWRNHYLKTYPNGTQLCTSCSPCYATGEGVKALCTRRQDTICRPCHEGTYSPHGVNHCRKCKPACPPFFEKVKNCTSRHNIRCRRCRWGEFYNNDTSTCDKCGECPPGTIMRHECSMTSDIRCESCSPGTFTDKPNTDFYCLPCEQCHQGQSMKRNCTSTADTICDGCKTGYFHHKGRCLKCSKCNSDDGNSKIQVEECLTNGADPNYSCFPANRSSTILTRNYTSMRFMENETGQYSIPIIQKHRSSITTDEDPLLAIVVITSSISILVVFVFAVSVVIKHSRKQRRFEKINDTTIIEQPYVFGQSHKEVEALTHVNHKQQNFSRVNSEPSFRKIPDPFEKSTYSLDERQQHGKFPRYGDVIMSPKQSSSFITELFSVSQQINQKEVTNKGSHLRSGQIENASNSRGATIHLYPQR